MTPTISSFDHNTVFMVQGNERHCEAQLVCRNEKEDGLCCKWAFIECHGIFSL